MQTWSITITSPLGETRAELRFEETGGTLVGEMTGRGGAGAMEGGRVEGDRLSWSCRIEKPVPMTLKFSGARDGDGMAGTVKFGMFASGRFEAARV